MAKETSKNKRRFTLVLMMLIGIILEGSWFVSYPHEFGHYITANMAGGHAEIYSPYETSVSWNVARNPFVRAAGYSTEILIWFFLILLTPRGGYRNYIGVGGMGSTIMRSVGGVDFTGYPDAVLIYVFVIAISLGILIMTRKNAEKSQKPAPKVQKTPPIRYERYQRQAEVTMFTTRPDNSVVVNTEKRPYTGSNRIIAFQSERRDL